MTRDPHEVLHLGPTLSEGARAAQAQADARAGRSSRFVGPEPRGTGRVRDGEVLAGEPSEAARWCLHAVAAERGRLRPEVVVAHGWAAVPAAERIARRSAAALIVSAPEDDHGALAAWGRDGADLVVGLTTAERPLDAAVYHEALAKREVRAGTVRVRSSEEKAPALPAYDLVVRVEGLDADLLDLLLVRLERVKLLRGAAEATWAAACAGARLALLAGGQGSGPSVRLAADAGCVPIVLGGRAEDPRAVVAGTGDPWELLGRWLRDPELRAAQLARAAQSQSVATSADLPVVGAPCPPRALRLVLNHGGWVAQELQASLAPLGWELRPLLGPGRDPLPAADLLVVLPYGDPRGGLEALRRARRLGVPTALWNVEDPRYFFDPELGPHVKASAREATVTFSTTTQLAEEYRSLGVDLRYLPNYGRSQFMAEEPLDDAARTTDVVFLGTLTPARLEFVEAYRAALRPGVSLVVRDDVRDPADQGHLVRHARLGLSVGSMTDAVSPRGPLRGEGVTERAFDYPLAWTPVLHDERGHLSDHFTDGEELFLVRDPSDAADMTHRLLANPALRARVAGAARRLVLERHLGRHRLLSIVEALAATPGCSPALAAAASAARGGA